MNIYPQNGVGCGGDGVSVVYYRYHRGRVIKMSLARLPEGPRALHDADVFNTQRFRHACIVREHRAAAPPPLTDGLNATLAGVVFIRPG